MNPDIISIDYNVDPSVIRETIDIPVQGGLDPKILLQNKEIGNYIKKSQNDICCHGYRWEEHYKLTKKKEQNQISRAFNLIHKLINKLIDE